MSNEQDIAHRLLATADALRVLRGEFARLVHSTRPDLLNTPGSQEFRQQANKWAGVLAGLASQLLLPPGQQTP